MAFSKVMIIGNLGRDPEMRYTPNGRAVTEFSVAVTHSSRDPQTGEWADEQTDWFRVTRLGRPRRAHRRAVPQGQPGVRRGSLPDPRVRAPRTAPSGISLEITADNVIALERRSRDEEGSFGTPAANTGEGAPVAAGSGVRPQRAPADDTDLDDLPF